MGNASSNSYESGDYEPSGADDYGDNPASPNDYEFKFGQEDYEFKFGESP